MRIGLHGRHFPASTARLVTGILERMKAAGAEPVLEKGLARHMQRLGVPPGADVPLTASAAEGQVDLWVSLGGDGSFLDTVAFVGRSGIPVLGINLGRLGFLSNTRLEDVDRTVQAVLDGRWTIEERGLLALHGVEAFAGATALNEVSIHKRDGAAMITVHARLDGRYLNTYWVDGLLIATPTGSTAYSLSCGGPILAPESDAMVITPIAPHNLNVRPFVVPGGSRISLNVDTRGEKYLVNMDSRSVVLAERKELLVHGADHKVRLVQLVGQDFLDTLRSKLSWGLDVRSGRMEDGA
jgi:NAD+ kinase